MRNIFFLCLFLGISSSVLAQSKHTIPVHTAYLLPATEEEPFISENGKQVYQWSDAKQSISFFFYHTKPGTLMLSLNGAAVKINQQIQVTVGGKLFNVLVPVSTRSKEIRIGSLPVTDSGFMEVVISAKKLVSKGIKIESLIVAGNGAEALRYNAKPRRNAASVHLRYPLADSIRAIGFYNEVTVPKGYDPVHSFYMANGFSRGYFGIQVNSEKERRVIFLYGMQATKPSTEIK